MECFMKKICLMLFVVTLLFTGCTRDSDDDSTDTDTSTITTVVDADGNAVIEVTEVDKYVSNDIPMVLINFENTGSETAYALACTVSAMDEDAILETVEADISTRLDSLILEDGDNSAFDISFSTANITTHSDYDSLRIDFTWQEEYSGRVDYRLITK
jgi:hypothetical protein